jgi:pyruvate dehydrogenase E1 component alpha subunit
MDVLAVHYATQRAIERARGGGGPTFLMCMTYRYGGHHVGDKQDYKDDAEANAWRLKDPIERLAGWLKDAGTATAEQIASLQKEVDAEVRAAIDQAKAAPQPSPNDLAMHLHG